ncbi:ABC transporter substrate-binding protein [Desulfohalobium retbaense]|uniref:Substrate-binding region of ABC-type glycine betaine transport system n=1 Tax=Desulfohalobium retbaense (strain ATCC 49708 / DSM 5692 / JCM 16813 / HR100) TaxID=485915 RepID=C8X3Y9_DESRD|nr:ABC transporter substrate-binding protein [Desulfohalobium retbaense]ACV69136.1 Substrate-binding region of ABC-type glycine betaine transport system [Desulfohalobium retbaense DSM 5692]
MKKTFLLISLLCLTLLFPAAAFAQKDTIRLGVPPWPGVTVKTEVATQILEAMGYETQQLEIGPPIIYKGLTTGEIDAYLAAWLPQQTDMFEPLKEKGAIDVININLDDAMTGFAVPTYVWEAGIHSVADLAPNADKFDSTLHTIEVGSGMHTTTEEMVKNDVASLGDWELASSTTPAMLTEVNEKTKSKEWVVFHAWKPHWMTIKIDMKFLEGVPGSEDLISESVVYNVASPDFQERFPQARKFLEKFYVSGDTQSAWIHSFSYEKKDPEDVAREWIANNMETVSQWLDGVETTDGRPAIDAVKNAVK